MVIPLVAVLCKSQDCHAWVSSPLQRHSNHQRYTRSSLDEPSRHSATLISSSTTGPVLPRSFTATTTKTCTLSRLYLHPLQRTVVPTDTVTTTLLAPWEAWCLLRLETSYRKALRLKCPFLRRRASDSLDALEQVLRFIIIRHKSLDLIGPPVGWRCEGDLCDKERHLSTAQVMARIQADWRPDNHKGYYITGRLSTALYRDDCFFDGPDPDMPVKGLRKYLNAASQLFETKSSVAELLHMEHDPETDLITAKWRMKGVLRLPWRPALPEWTGTTTYHRDEEGLIYRHTETWDLSVTQAFLKTMWPELSRRIWQENEDILDEDEACQIDYS